MKALIVVDIQNDFCPGGALAVADGDEVVPVANRLLSRFSCAVATQDLHPRAHLSFAANHPGHNTYDVIDLEGLSQVLWPVHCVTGTHGSAFHPDLAIAHLSAIVPKGTDPHIDSYSGFFDNGHRKATGLELVLRERQVEAVYVLGLATDYCVKATALDAVALGFRTFVVRDGCRAVNLHPDDGDKAFEAMHAAGIAVIESAELA
jgi:nicotinamidase/pyrazinamidase